MASPPLKNVDSESHVKISCPITYLVGITSKQKLA